MSQQTRTKKTKKENASLPASAIPVGVVGVGVMGAIITTCLLAGGHPVFAVSLEDAERKSARRRVRRHLAELHKAGALKESPAEIMSRLQIAADYSALATCELVVESIIEDLKAKHAVIKNVEAVVSPQALIGTNTSALPITEIQKRAKNPQRILGLHWVSSSPFGFVVEVMGGDQTTPAATQRACELVRLWGKTPALSRRDKRGFICNRVGYAMLREAFALLDEDVATPQEIDDALRASLGTWLPLVGPFGYMDLSGLPAYAGVMRHLFADLSSSQKVPAALQKMVDSDAQGIVNGRGFYNYEGDEGARRRQDFDDFRRDLRALTARYEAKAGRNKKR